MCVHVQEEGGLRYNSELVSLLLALLDTATATGQLTLMADVVPTIMEQSLVHGAGCWCVICSFDV